ncbi:hypothetical protein FHT44_005189 [Mycolicibacterium sp. BK634]|uniref:hypothetical protein n=1 Tax=Mycolicibacterium sp. BK634 TaxID=2587099 RepID=UPI0016230EA7|nr:hypothetical protein [Mycolicibacterium sp. BK634]MBB3752677.1 hypothetical protein [Mycolicibacterium sp. BK634]
MYDDYDQACQWADIVRGLLEVIERGQVYENDEIPDLSEIGGYWEERLPLHHNGQFVYPGRRVGRLSFYHQWPYEPEECQAERGETIWIMDGRILLCRGCGVDGT